MTVETIWNRLTRVVLWLLGIAAVLAIGVWYLPLIRQNESMRKEDLRLDGELRKQEEVVRQKKAAIEGLRNDPKTIERLARETLGVAKTGETVVHFEAPATNVVRAKP
jgi:cell division protein FtsB